MHPKLPRHKAMTRTITAAAMAWPLMLVGGCGDGEPSESDVAGMELRLSTELMLIGSAAADLCNDQEEGAVLNFGPIREARSQYSETYNRGTSEGLTFDLPRITKVAGTPYSASTDWCAAADEIDAIQGLEDPVKKQAKRDQANQESAYIRSVYIKFPEIDSDEALKRGRQFCADLDNGATIEDLGWAEAEKAVEAGTDDRGQDATTQMVFSAATDLCPDHASKIDSFLEDHKD